MQYPRSSTEELLVRELNCVSHGAISMMGRRRSMDNALTVAPGAVAAGAYDFFAVYDGYGCGYNVAKAYSCRLHKLLALEVVAACEEIIDWKKVMATCFRKMDEEASWWWPGGDGRAAGGGQEDHALSSAAVVVVGKEEIVVANCGGDSRVVLCGRDSVIPLSDHYKPDGGQDRTEMVHAAEGRIINKGDGPSVSGILTTSKSIGYRGDHEDHLRAYVVISEPVVRVTKRRESDKFLVMGSRGLWNAVSDEVACSVVKRCLEAACGDRTHEAAALLAALAIARGSMDNITTLVLQLNTPSPSPSPI